jgi:nitroimidazol reductase NimA-like FMN-containing flavoprotein (pyridoxamine 5'-phosphate oxidase superfamily)
MKSGRASEPDHLSRTECLARLAGTQIGRVGISIDALPVILPVHFVLHNEAIVFRTVRGTRLDGATVGAVVAFQADARDEEDGSWWSVLVQGIGRPAGEEETARGGPSLESGHWAGPGQEHRLVSIRSDTMTGRRFARGTHGLGPDPAL